MASAQAKAFGGGKEAAYDDMDADEDMDMPGDTELPPDYESAYDAYAESPSAQTFWEAVKACTEAYGGKGDALLIGVGKPKKT